MSAASVNPWTKWVDFLYHEESGESLALTRILCGAAILIELLSIATSNVVVPLFAATSYGGIHSYPSLALPLSMQLEASKTAAWLLWALGVGTALSLTLGYRPGLCALLLGIAYRAMFQTQSLGLSSVDQIAGCLLWVLVFARSGTTLSFQSRMASGNWQNDNLIAAWPRYLAIWQIVAIYFTTGVQKLGKHWMPWGDLDALYYALQNPFYQVITDQGVLARLFPLTQLGTLATWFWELTFPVVLWAVYYKQTEARGGRIRALYNRLRVRSTYVLLGIGFHLGVLFAMRVSVFSLLSMAFYPCLFYPAEVRQIIVRLSSWCRVRRRAQ